MSDNFNPLNPNVDLSCPNLRNILVMLQKHDHEEVADAAGRELSRLLEIIKAQREQMERTQRVLDDSVFGIKQTLAWNKRLDELVAENKSLKEQLKLRD